jgi:excisionase family DNA binding protein
MIMALKDEYLTVTQAASKLGVTRQTVYRWIANNQLATEKIGREILVSKKVINDYDEKLFFRSLGNIIMDKIGEAAQQPDKDKDIEGIKVLKPNPDEPFYDYLITYRDGSSRKMTFEYNGYKVNDVNKTPTIMKITFTFKRTVEDIPRKNIKGNTVKE